MAFAEDYIDVATRIAEFRQQYPTGSLCPLDPDKPYEVLTIGDRAFVVCVSAAYRTPDDPRPGVGIAWQPFPGKTPYTKDSELMNAQTGSWGRAIVAALAADAKKGIATTEDVRNRQAANDERKEEPPRDKPASSKTTTSSPKNRTGNGAAAGKPKGAAAPEPDLPPEIVELQNRYQALCQRGNDVHAAILADKRKAGIGKLSQSSDKQLAAFREILERYEQEYAEEKVGAAFPGAAEA